MHKTTILFGYPKDSTEFDRHYHEVHLPLTSKLKGIRGLTIGKLEAGDNGEDQERTATRRHARQEQRMNSAPVSREQDEDDQSEAEPKPVPGNALADHRQANLNFM